jgi:hypothetical protein
MRKYEESLKTVSPEARKRFTHGERSFRAYLAGGNVQFLEEAKTNFLQAIRRDSKFDLARFYLGIAQTQLRETDESIPALTQLQQTGATFEGQVALQLAYAHIKTYEDQHYALAENLLDKLVEDATSRGQDGLRLQAEALQVFLYSVMAGHLTDEARRPHYAQLALQLGDKLVTESYDEDEAVLKATLFDTYNGLGIVWMRIGQERWLGFDNPETSWAYSQQYYLNALALRPNAVPVLQNIGSLQLLRSELAQQNGQPELAASLRSEAKTLYLRSLEFNDHDQFPFYRLAQIAVAEQKKQEALGYIQVGVTKPGAVKDSEWNEVFMRANELPDPPGTSREPFS